jgi:hypothetical protein
LSNRRTDEYGGSFENRIRFPLEVVEEIRKAAGLDSSLLYRLGAYDGGERGVNITECQAFARKLVDAGVNIIDVSGGLAGSNPEGLVSQGYILPLAEKIKKAVAVPVIGTGGIKDPKFADKAIRRNRVDLVAVGRAILRDFSPSDGLIPLSSLTAHSLVAGFSLRSIRANCLSCLLAIRFAKELFWLEDLVAMAIEYGHLSRKVLSKKEIDFASLSEGLKDLFGDTEVIVLAVAVKLPELINFLKTPSGQALASRILEGKHEDILRKARTGPFSKEDLGLIHSYSWQHYD